MAMFGSLRREERIGLAVALGMHGALVLAFLLQPETRADIAPAQRMTVNLASEVGLEAAAPEPVPESRAAIAPTLSDEPAPAPAPQPTPQPRLERPVAASVPTPADARPRRRPDKVTPAKAATKGGGSRIGDDFLPGMGDSTKTSETRVAAMAMGASEKASIAQAVARQLKPYWQPPSGPDVNQIVSRVRFRLNPDGSLSGRPELVGQPGVNATNRTQAGRHGELAIRAVQLAAPFDLPEKHYDGWKVITANLDWKLAQ